MAGYLGAIPVPQATQHRESFTATSGQTTFNTAGYTVGFLDVYLNGSHLSPADFTATNGSDVVLASGASTGDVCDIISYTAFEIADQTFTGTTTMDVAAITGVLTTTAATVFNGGFASNAASSFGADVDLLQSKHIRFKHAAGGTIRASISAESDDKLQFSTGSSETARMTIDTNGNVGIGTSSPVSGTKLTLNDSAFGGMQFQSGGSDCGYIGVNTNTLYVGAGSTLAFHTGNAQATDGSERMRIDATGAVTMPAQPAFQVKPASNQNNIAVGSAVSVVFGTEIFDQNADFASNTFTAPVTGKYYLDVHLYIESIDTAADYYQLQLITSNRTYYQTMDFGGHSADPVYGRMSLSVLADMDASDTSTVKLQQVAGTAQTDVKDLSFFSGYLVA